MPRVRRVATLSATFQYHVVAYRSISDESAVKAYGSLAGPAIQALGGRLLTSSTSQVQVHEAEVDERVVVVEFDSYESAQVAHKSEAYQKALQALGSGAERDFHIVEGIFRNSRTKRFSHCCNS